MELKRIHTPEGVRDIYGDELTRKIQIKKVIRKALHKYGYMDIETPTFEFNDIFSGKVGTTPDNELYKFFDKEGNTLALRPDFTPSIARCAAKYFLEDSMPIKLCYEGSSFSNNSNLQGKLKESTQMGAELINDGNTSYGDAEIISLVINSLKDMGFSEFMVSIGDISYFKGVCKEAGLSDEDVSELREFVSIKNYFGAEDVLVKKGISREYIDCLLNVSEISTVDELRAIKGRVKNEDALAAIERLEEIYNILALEGIEQHISFDLSMVMRFDYYSGVVFRAYTYGVGDAIVKGGRYDNLLGKFGKEATAIGFVFLVDDIMSALAHQKIVPRVDRKYAMVVYTQEKYDEAIKAMIAMRNDGKLVSGILMDDSKTKADYEEYASKNSSELIFYV